MNQHILILGGTTEARQLATHLANHGDLRVTLSLAGRTAAPPAQPVPVRSGGFGGVAGLAQFLVAHDIAAMVDATHPYAAAISAHAVQAALQTGTPLATLHRPAWRAVAGDRWTELDRVADAVRILGVSSRNVFLALGRQHIGDFRLAPQHHYLIRSVDAVEPPLPVPHARYIQERGPFTEDAERTLLLEHAIEFIVAKNSGGPATYGKIAAARALGIEVLMLRRPAETGENRVTRLQEIVDWLHQILNGGIDRGV